MKKYYLILFLLPISLSIYCQQWSGSTDINNFIWRNGRIGIGTPTPAHPLHSVGNYDIVQLRLERAGSAIGYCDLGGSNGDFRVWAGGFDAGKKFVIQNNTGYVGIGTITPYCALHSVGIDNLVQLRLERAGTNTGVVDLGGWNGDFRVWAGGFEAEKKFIIQSSTGYVGIGNVNPQKILHTTAIDDMVQLRLERAGTNPGFVELGGISGDFRVWPGGFDAGKKFVIKAGTGYVGIGTDLPQKILHSAAKDDLVQLRLERTGTSPGFVDLGGSNGDFRIWAGGFDNGKKFIIKSNTGFVGIGLDIPNYELDVKGTIRADEVKVNLQHGADFVFSPTYNLPTLTEVETFIKENQHLPDVPPANQMETEGVNVAEMNALLLQKIEELTLYVIELKRENEEIKKMINEKQ